MTSAKLSLPDKIVRLHHQLADADLPHAFGGALALAWCTQRARGTIDIDVNIFVGPAELDRVAVALAPTVPMSDAERELLARDGQIRLWWDETPVDVFLNTTPFHEEVGARARQESFNGHVVPFLACRDLAVFKAFFDRTKDWADLEEMHAAGSLDAAGVLGVLTLYLGGDDPRIGRLRELALSPPAG